MKLLLNKVRNNGNGFIKIEYILFKKYSELLFGRDLLWDLSFSYLLIDVCNLKSDF